MVQNIRDHVASQNKEINKNKYSRAYNTGSIKRPVK